MATPTENLQKIRAYWQEANALKLSGNTTLDAPSLIALARLYYAGATAMKELVRQAGDNTYTRNEVFAANSVFEQALTGEPWDVHHKFSSVPLAEATAREGDRDVRPLRQIMLDGIYKAGAGGLFSPRDPSGVTSWLRSVDVSAGAVVATLKGDKVYGVVAVMAQIIRDLALPVFWLEALTNQQAFPALESRLVTTPWFANQKADLAARVTLQGLAASASGRVATDLAKLAQAKLPTLPVPTGSGETAPTVPPVKKRWYQRGELWAAMSIGVIGGGAAATRPR